MAGADRCPIAHCGARLEFRSDGLGRVVAHCPWCARRRAGLCRECPRPVAGTVGKALRCVEYTADAKRRAWRKSDAEHRAARRAADRKRWRTDAERRARKREARRAWMAAHPDRVKAYRRRYDLKRTPGYIAGYTRNNARPERAEAKRAQAMARYYELHPTRPAPVCRLCGASIPFTGTGRPRATCLSRGKCDRAGVIA